MNKKVLFICTGNYYRSRFAEIWFNYQADKLNLPLEAFSRGFKADNPLNKGFLSPFCCQQLSERDINWPERLPIRLSELDLAEADLIIAMKLSEHLPMCEQLFPAWTDKIIFWNVNDIDGEEPESAIAHLEYLLYDLLSQLSDSGLQENSLK